MLTCKSKMGCLWKGMPFDYTELTKLCKIMILDDKINFNCNKVGQGFPEAIARMIADKIDGAKKDSSILIFNNFSLILYDMLKERGYNNIYICYHDFSSETGCQIVYSIMKDYISANFGEAEEILSRVISYGEVLGMSKKFDFIISNPPYAIGNKITKAIVENVNFDTMVNLMPASKYKGGNLYEHVSELSSAEDTFEDALVGDSLTVAVLKKENAGVYHSYEEFENEKRDPRFQEFYKLNMRSCQHPLNYQGESIHERTEVAVREVLAGISIDNDFMITMRTVLDGTHRVAGDSHDIHWNVQKDVTNADIPVAWDKYLKYWKPTVTFVHLNSSVAKDHLCRFWYYNPLANDLIKGLHKSSGSVAPAIPRIDWSVERDYEHLTLEDLMTILREEA